MNMDTNNIPDNNSNGRPHSSVGPVNDNQQQQQQQQQHTYTSMAHVFCIDPITKRSWTPKSDQAVPVSLVLDLRKRILKLIGTNPEQKKTILSSDILPKTIFTRTSQKFGQWTDSAADTVYGLGFAREIEFNKFVDKFQEFKKMLLPIVTPSTNYSSQTLPHSMSSKSSSSSWINNNMVVDSAASDINQAGLESTQLSNNNQQRQQAQPINQQRHHLINTTTSSGSMNMAPDSNGNSLISNAGLDGADITANNNNSSSNNSTMSLHHRSQQLKYENERLRLALAKNSDNAKEWAIEVEKLRTKIQTLTSALQQSSANKKEWEQQLSTLKSKNDKYQMRILELEASCGDPQARIKIQDRMNLLNNQLEDNQNELKKKELEIGMLKKKLDELQETKNSSKVNNGVESHDPNKFEVVFTKFGSKVRELGQIHQEFGQLLESK